MQAAAVAVHALFAYYARMHGFCSAKHALLLLLLLSSACSLYYARVHARSITRAIL
jgi:hypothetical protein